jgi:hypothetical protein
MKAKVVPHLEAQVRVGRGIPHSKDILHLLRVQYSKGTCVKKQLVFGDNLKNKAK